MAPSQPLNPFILKVASRCNLNCSYCYVYNQADSSWRERPSLMSPEVFDATLRRIRRHLERSRQDEVTLLFHGGEPTLIGHARLGKMCARARDQLSDLAAIRFALQTNGTRLSPEWARVLLEHEIDVGVSLDGPKAINDAARVDHRGRGSHDAVARGIGVLHEHEIPFSILSVIQLGANPLPIHRHFLELGCVSISYLMPSHTYENIGPVRRRFGPTPCADYLIPIFDEWWENSSVEVFVREFWEIGRLIMGGASHLDVFGNRPIRFVTVETDGSIHGLEKLRTCEDGMTNTTLSVFDSDFDDVRRLSTLHAQIMDGLPLPTGCRACPERDTCAGGYVPQRYSRERGFDNPSVWCADLLKLFAHIRRRLEISPEETETRRHAQREAVQARAAMLATV